MKRVGLYLVGLLLCAGRAWGIDPEFALQQLNHRTFTVTEGAPAPVYALTQTEDGTLWVAGAAGLFRFDGIRFVHYPGPPGSPFPSADISALIGSADGDLWVGFRLGGISRVHQGHLTSYGEHEGLPPGTVKALALDHDGTLWIGTTNGLASLQGTHLETVAADLIPTVTGVFVDPAGTLWVATAAGVLARPRGAAHFREVSRELSKEQAARFNGAPMTFVTSADGRIWTASGNRVTRLDSPSDSPPRNLSFYVAQANRSLLADHDGNLWVGAETDLKQWPASQRLADEQANASTAHVQTLGPLTGTPKVLLEDREHNIWVGTTAGLDRFSLTNVVRALPGCREGGWTLAAGDPGALWALCPSPDSLSGHLVEIRAGRVVSQRRTAAFTAAYRDPQGEIWWGGPTALGHLAGGALRIIPLPKPLYGFDVQTIAGDPGGALWISVVRKGLFRFLKGQWVAYGGIEALPRGPAIVATPDGQGAIWFGYPNNRIARLSGAGTVRVFDATDGLNVGNVTAIHVSRGGVWIGGEAGLARFDGARFVPIAGTAGVLKGISGIATAPDGSVWLNGAAGIAHITAPELERALRNPAHAVRCDMTDYLDGVPGPPVQLRPVPSVMATGEGRLWFDMLGGLIWIDTRHWVRNTLPPPVTIWSVSSAGRQYPNSGAALQLPVLTTRLQIDYTAGSLTIPERVRFRYKLEGSDRDWQDGGAARGALYTNLGPGRYTFRVIASNNDGVWNNTGASIDFTIHPAFYQTRWFYALCSLLCLIVLALMYRLRIHQVGAQIRARLEERLAERERIARELHDTLLQGVQGLIWRFQTATDRLPPAEKARELLEQSIERAEQLLTESRNRVKDLRTPLSSAVELSKALATEGEHLALAGKARFTASVEGELRGLHPIVREEAFLITREALTNAFRHAGAQHIEAEVHYGARALQVRVRDDGCGMPPEGLRSAQDARHFGLLGMRERARRIRAELVVWSKPGVGTEIDLKVAAHVAYPMTRQSRWHRSWRRLRKNPIGIGDSKS